MKYLILPLLAIIITACTEETAPNPIPDAPIHQRVAIQLLVAPWCESCMAELPEVETRYKSIDQSRVFIEAVVETGRQPNSTPTLEVAELVKKATQVTFDVRPDESKWKLYRQYIGTGNYYLPAALVFAEDENCVNDTCELTTTYLRSFVAPYTVQELLDYSLRQLKN